MPSDYSQSQLSAVARNWLQPEYHQLEDLYGIKVNGDSAFAAAQESKDIAERLQALGITSFGTRSLDEGQEREFVHEVERERQVSRPPPRNSQNHLLSKEVIQFARMGTAVRGSQELLRAEEALTDIATWKKHNDVRVFGGLLVTRDYIRTVEKRAIKSFLKNVNWVLRSRRDTLIISQFEAAALKTILLRESCEAHLCLFSPRVTQQAPSLDGLNDFYVVPDQSLSSPLPYSPQLALFSGELYPPGIAEFRQFCSLREFF